MGLISLKGSLARCGRLVRVGAVVAACVGTTVAAPVRLKVEQRINPLGIDVKRPVLSWQSDSTERNWKQTAYEIRVSSTTGGLVRGRPDVWDSGKISSSESVGIPYGGPDLKSRQRYYWTVEVWDGEGRSSLAPIPGWWETGLLEASDWSAKWIHREDQESARELREAKLIGSPAAKLAKASQPAEVAFRYKLHLEEKPFSASLHIFSPGKFVTRVNGTVTGHKAEWIAFDREDILDRLRYGKGAAGDNIITVDVDSQSVRKDELPLPATLTAVLRVDERAGQRKAIVTDRRWEVSDNGGWVAAKELGSIGELPLETAPIGPPMTVPARIDSEASLLRKEFPAQSGVVSARLYVTALGSYRMFLNGHRVGDDVLTPGFTDFRKRALYQTYDVTSLVSRTSGNVLAATLGAGWHGSPMMWLGARLFPGPDMMGRERQL